MTAKAYLIPFVVSLTLMNFVVVSGLKCFDCGLYIAPEVPYPPLTVDGPLPGKIFPCTNMTLEHIKECKPHENACMKYVNKGLEVHLCSDHCTEDVNYYSEREIHCCYDDACNESYFNFPSASTTVASIILSLLLSLTL